MLNFNIVCYSENDIYYDGDGYEHCDKYKRFFFYEHQKEDFIKTWAKIKIHSVYEIVEILIDGFDLQEITANLREQLLTEMNAEYYKLSKQHEETKPLTKTELDALEMAKLIDSLTELQRQQYENAFRQKRMY